MVAHVNRFLSSGAGLEKTLRLIQSLSQIATVFTVGSTAVRFTAAKLQLALSMLIVSCSPHSSKLRLFANNLQLGGSSVSSASSIPSSVFPRC